jgi:hypothetical protein
MPRYRCLIEYEATDDQEAQLRAGAASVEMGAGLHSIVVQAQGWKALPSAIVVPDEGPAAAVPEEAPWDVKA